MNIYAQIIIESSFVEYINTYIKALILGYLHLMLLIGSTNFQ